MDDDLAEVLKPRPRRRLSAVTALLGTGVILTAGFIGGIEAHKRWGETPAAPAVAGAPQRAPAGVGNQASGKTTMGTIKLVDGSTIYVQTLGGEVVRVKTSESTKVRVAKKGSANDLKPGSSVIVNGQAGSDGSVSATEVNESAGLPSGVRPR